MKNSELIIKFFGVIKEAESNGTTMPEVFGAICALKSLYEVEFLTAYVKKSMDVKAEKETE